jgi:exodeoxyribonuclease VII large subunit
MQARQRVDDLMARGERAIRHELGLHRERLDGLMGRLTSVSPVGTLERGYAIVRSCEKDMVVRSIEQIVSGDGLAIRVVDGEFEAQVK